MAASGWRVWPLAAALALLLASAGCLTAAGPEPAPRHNLGPRAAPMDPAALEPGRGAVRLEVGEDLGAAVAAQPPGTTFVIAAGLHREQHIDVRDGDRYLAEEGAVLSGARVLTDVRRDGDGWVAATGPLGSYEANGDMEDGWEREAYPHDVWIGDERLRHVASPGRVGPGAFWMDYGAGEVRFGTDPAGRSVELSVTDFAFVGEGTRDVTIAGVEVRRYASVAQRGAISAFATQSWTLRDVRAVENHAAGIRIGAGTVLDGCVVADNGQLGIGGGEEEPGERPIVVRGCEIARNAVLGYDWSWEAGGAKFTYTTGMLFERNWVHDNRGAGAWWDIDSVDTVIRSNRVERNSLIGIFYEISYGALIEGNVLRDNGADGFGDIGSGIYVSNSSDVEIRGNLLQHNRVEVIAAQHDRGTGLHGRYAVTGLRVIANDLTIDQVAPGLRVYDGSPGLLDSHVNRFAGNTWRMGPDAAFWWGGRLDAIGWRAAGNDRDGAFTGQSVPGALAPDVEAMLPPGAGPP